MKVGDKIEYDGKTLIFLEKVRHGYVFADPRRPTVPVTRIRKDLIDGTINKRGEATTSKN